MNCMNCICNNNNGKQGVIVHPVGNFLNLRIPLRFRAHTVINGEEEKHDEDSLKNIGDVSVELRRGKHVYHFAADIQDGYISFIDEGTLPVGTYDIAMSFKSIDFDALYKQRGILRIVDSTADGGHYKNGSGIDLTGVYPVLKGNIVAISVGDTSITINEAGKYTGDDTPDDDKADISAEYGDKSIEIGDETVTINT